MKNIIKKINISTVIICILSFTLGWNLVTATIKVIGARKEIQFAIEKPHLVKGWRESYETNIKTLEKEFVPSEDENTDRELIDEILKQFKTGKM